MTRRPVLLEVGRVGRAHGLRGEVHVVAVSNVDERFAPGSQLFVGERRSSSMSARAAAAAAGSCSSRASTTATRPRRLRGKTVLGDASPDAPDGELWVHERDRRRGARPRGRAARASSRRCRRTRRTTCWCSTPARWSRWCSSSTRAGRRRRRPARRTAWICSDAHRRVHDLPRVPRGAARGRRSSAARAKPGLLDVRLHDPRDCDDRRAPLGRRRAVRRWRGHGDDAGADLRRGRSRATAAAAVLAVGGGPPLRPGTRRASSRRRTASRCCAAATKASTSASPTTAATASCRSATTCSRAARSPRSSVIEAVTRLVPGVMGNEASAAEESFGRDGAARVPAVHAAGASSASWDVPEVLRSGDHARVAPVAAGPGAAADAERAGPISCRDRSRPTEQRLLGRVPAGRGRPLASRARASHREHSHHEPH